MKHPAHRANFEASDYDPLIVLKQYLGSHKLKDVYEVERFANMADNKEQALLSNGKGKKSTNAKKTNAKTNVPTLTGNIGTSRR